MKRLSLVLAAAMFAALPLAAFEPSSSNPYTFTGTNSCSTCETFAHEKMGDGNFHSSGCGQSGSPLYFCGCSIGYASGEMLQKPILTVLPNGNVTLEYWAKNAYCNPPADGGDIHEPNAIPFRINVIAIDPVTLTPVSTTPVHVIPPYWEHGKVTMTDLSPGCTLYRAVYSVLDTSFHQYAVSSNVVGATGGTPACLADVGLCPTCNGGSGGGSHGPAGGRSPGVGRPINVGSGNMYYDLALFRASEAGAAPLDFSISYNSRETAGGPLGVGFRHSLAQRFEALANTSVRLWRAPDGTRVLLARENHPAINHDIFRVIYPADLTGTISENTSTSRFAYTELDGTVTEVDNNTTAGVWRKTTDRWGNSLTAGYDSGGNMTTVTDTDGRVWTFAYDSNHLLTSIIDRDGNQWRFAYDGSNRLEKIFDPLHTGTTPWRQFTWVTYDVNKPAVLALVKDESGAVLEGHEYDSNGRATSSWSGDTTSGSPPAPGTNARDLVTLSYDSSTQTTVSTKIDTSLTQSTVYTLTTGAGRFLATSIVGSCGTCGTAEDAVSYTWDSDNHALTKTVGLDKTSTGGTDERVTSTYTYNGDGLVLTEVQATGKTEEHTTTYAYGLTGWPEFVTAVTEASVAKPGQNRSITFAWNSSGTPETTLTTTRSGYLLSTNSSATTYTTTTLFDARHRTTEVDGPVTNQKTTWSYYGDTDSDLNRRGRLQQMLRYSTTSASLATTYDDYDVFGTARKETDANSVDRTLTTDGRGRTLTETSVKPSADSAEPASYVSTYVYDGRDRLTSMTLPRGNSVRYAYEDGTNRLLQTIRADSSNLEHERLLLTLNTIGQRTAEAAQDCATPANPCASWTTRRSEAFAYDASARLTTVTHPDSTTRTFAYDSRGNQTAAKDERHSSANSLFSYDFRNRLKQVTQKRTIVSGSDVVTQYSYDDQSNLTGVVDPNGNTTSDSFDDFGRMQKQISPVTGTTTYSYDAAGNLTSTTDANAATTARTYDLLDRVTGATSTRSGGTTETLSWTYDDATTGYYGKGRLASMTDPSGSTSFRYERRGLPRYEAKTIGGTAYTTSYGFDANGNRSSITYPSSRVVSYTFDFADRPLSAASSSTTYVSSAAYQPFGPQSQEVFGNSTTRTMTYDSRYRPTENKLMAGSSARADYTYTVDGAGNITAIHDALDSTYDRDFGYDDLNRLVTANGGTSLWGTGSYSYDAMGNLTALALGTTHTATFSYSGTTPKLTSVTENGSTGSVTYDSAGNETAAAGATSTITTRNAVGRTSHTTYVYDARGVRATASFDALQLSLSPAAVIGRATSHATVTLTLPAPTGGTVVSLSSSDTSLATVPSSVTVAASATQATFDITTFDVASTSTVTITASISGGAAATAVLTLTVPSYHVSTLVIDPEAVEEDGDTTTGTVTLAAAAPTGGARVLLSDDYDLEPRKHAVDPYVDVAGGQTSATFTVTGHRYCEFGDCGVVIHVTATLGTSVTASFSTGTPTIDCCSGTAPRPASHLSWLARLLHRRRTAPPPIALAFANARLTTDTTTDPRRHSLYTPELNLLSETDVTTATNPSIAYDYVWFNGHPVAQIDIATSTTHWTFTDHLGTPLLQTDASGLVDWRVELEPFGRTLAYRVGSTRHQPLRFPGQELESTDSTSEREYNIFRWYRGGWGRYTQGDPIGLTGGLDLYAYADDDPVGNLDVDGLQPFTGPQGAEMTCFFCVIYAEERGGSQACQAAVASTILNRLGDARRRGNATTICEVVKKPGAYRGWEHGKNQNYQQCQNCTIPENAQRDWKQVRDNFKKAFPVAPDARFYAATSDPRSIAYYENRSKPKKKGDHYFVRVPYPDCPSNQFYNETK